MRNRFMMAVLAVMIIISTGTAWAQEGLTRAEAKEAVQIAAAWLKLVDEGKYAESWDRSGSIFKTMITQDRWVDLLNQMRKPLGKLEARSVYVVEAQKNPPRAPAGEYMRLKYNTSFSKRRMTIETVALFKEKDGSYKVSGYIIMPNSSGVGMD